MEMQNGRFLRKSGNLDFSAVTDNLTDNECGDDLEEALAFVQTVHLHKTDKALFNQHTLFLSNLKNLETLGQDPHNLKFVKHVFSQVQRESGIEYSGL